MQQINRYLIIIIKIKFIIIIKKIILTSSLQKIIINQISNKCKLKNKLINLLISQKKINFNSKFLKK